MIMIIIMIMIMIMMIIFLNVKKQINLYCDLNNVNNIYGQRKI